VSGTVACDGPIGGFGRRLAAQLIDAIVWAFVSSLFAVALVYLAPNVFGLSNAFPRFVRCEPLSVIPTDVQVRDPFPNTAQLCSISYFGVRFRDEIRLNETDAAGNVVTLASYPVDEQRRPRQVFDLAVLLEIGFFAYLVFCQAIRGETLGKELLRLRVVGPDGGAPGWRPALLRNLVLSSPWLLVWILPASGFTDGSTPGTANSAAFFLNLALCVQVGLTASSGRPSLHDRLAGTRVILLPRSDRLEAAGLRPS
jgi:uncharacterized RDD family membrane protein YckC